MKLQINLYIGAKVVAEHKVFTPGAPAKLKLTLDNSGKAPQTGVKDVVFVYAQLLDAKNNPVTANNIAINFSLEGNGKLISPATITTSGGYASALVEVGDSLANLKISASTDALETASLLLETK